MVDATGEQVKPLAKVGEGGVDVGFYDNDAKFVVGPGDIQVFVGNSSDASDLTGTFTVT